MGLLRLTFQHFARRLGASRWLMATALAGAVCGVAVLVGIFYFSDVQAEAGLRHILSTTHPDSLNLTVAVMDRPLGPADYRRVDSLVSGAIQRRVAWVTRGTQRYGRAQSLPLAVSGPPGSEQYVSLFFRTEFERKARLVDGRWPTPSTDNVLEVAIGKETARVLEWQPGETLQLVPYQDDPAFRLPLRVVGIVEPIDESDHYWVSGLPTFALFDDGTRQVAPLYLPEQQFFDSFGARYASLVGNFWWLVAIDPFVLETGQVNKTRSAFKSLEADINKGLPRSLVLSGMGQTLAAYQRNLTLARVPLYLYGGLLALFTLFFLVVVVDLMMETRRRDLILTRSRGATPSLAMALAALGEGLAAAALALPAGLVLGVLLGRVLADRLEPIGIERGTLPGGLTPWLVLLALGLAGACLAAVLAVAYFQARRPTPEMEHERSRPPRTGFIQRYFLDVLVLAAAAWLSWQVRLRGGFFNADPDGGISVDIVAAISPPLALLAGALALVRVFPWVLRLLGWATSRLPVPWASFALRRAARDPGPSGAAVGLLMLAAALATYGGILAASLAQGQSDRARFSVGGEIVARGISPDDSEPATLRMLGQDEGVESVSAVFRGTLLLPQGNQNMEVAVLAVDPDTLAETTSYRRDFSHESLPNLLASLRYEGQHHAGVPVPTGTQRVGVWVRLTESQGLFQWPISLWARFRGSAGNYANVLLGDIPAQADWTWMEAPMPEPASNLAPPLHLTALFFSSADISTPSSGEVSLAQVTFIGAEGTTVAESFDGRRPWTAIQSSPEGASSLKQQRGTGKDGGNVAVFQWDKRPQSRIGGIYLPEGPTELTVVGGPGFFQDQRMVLQLGRAAVPVYVKHTAKYFPTVEPGKPFVLVGLSEYRTFVHQLPDDVRINPNEAWFSLRPGTDRGRLAAVLQTTLGPAASISDREALVELNRRDPFSGHAWLAFTIVGTGVLLVLALLGLLLHGATSVDRSRLDMAVAQVLGLSPRQLALALYAERLLAAVAGVMAGASLGLWLAHWTLGYLDIVSVGIPAQPPALLNARADMLLYICGGLLAASLMAAWATVLLARRLRVPDVLRQEE